MLGVYAVFAVAGFSAYAFSLAATIAIARSLGGIRTESRT